MFNPIHLVSLACLLVSSEPEVQLRAKVNVSSVKFDLMMALEDLQRRPKLTKLSPEEENVLT